MVEYREKKIKGAVPTKQLPSPSSQSRVESPLSVPGQDCRHRHFPCLIHIVTYYRREKARKQRRAGVALSGRTESRGDVPFREVVKSEALPLPLPPPPTMRPWAIELAANVNWAQLNFI